MVHTRSTAGVSSKRFLDVVVWVPKLTLSQEDKKKVGCSAAAASRGKFNLYNRNYEMLTPAAKLAGSLIPLAFETSGAMDSNTHNWIREMARATPGAGSKGEYSMRVLEIMQRVSVALQRGNVRMIRHWQTTAFPPAAAPQVAAAGGQQALPPAVV
jgi:hypothetical protein